MITCQFDLTNSSGKLLYTRIHISPINAPISYNSTIVSCDSVQVHDIKQASVSIDLVPNYYQVRFLGWNTQTEFIIYLPASEDGNIVNACDYIVACPEPYIQSVPFAIAAGTLITTGSNIQFLAGQLCIWDEIANVWLPLVCKNGVLGVGDPV